MKGELVTTVTGDGLELRGFFSDNGSDVAVFHSHGTAGDFYTHKFIEVEGERLATEKISFLSANNRGHDVYADIRKIVDGKTEWASVGGGFEKFEDCLTDISAWLNFLESRGIKKVILQAHSLTQKILYYQSMKKDNRVIAQIHLSPCNDAGFMFYRLGEQKYKEVNAMVRRMVEKEGRATEMLPKELAVVCPMAAQAYYGYLTEEGVGNLFPYHNPSSSKWETLEKTTEPLLAVFGGNDAFINGSMNTDDANKVASRFKEKAKSAKSIEVKVINNSAHSYIEHEDELANVIVNWVKSEIR
ncbi:MAG: DUF1749 domain-containing protein [Candidatus Micrarchaeales archaeon]|nr:DUF1749 domain-containing protein [Candidatus Micrarchaeales archaeon]